MQDRSLAGPSQKKHESDRPVRRVRLDAALAQSAKGEKARRDCSAGPGIGSRICCTIAVQEYRRAQTRSVQSVIRSMGLARAT
jgi:hypothetical protein